MRLFPLLHLIRELCLEFLHLALFFLQKFRLPGQNLFFLFEDEPHRMQSVPDDSVNDRKNHHNRNQQPVNIIHFDLFPSLLLLKFQPTPRLPAIS